MNGVMFPDDNKKYEFYRATIKAPASSDAIIISSGEITISGNQMLRFETLQSETGSSDNLTIVVGGNKNELLSLSPKSGHTITVQASADILMAGDFIMNSPHDVLVLQAIAADSWKQFARNSNA